MMSWKQREED